MNTDKSLKLRSDIDALIIAHRMREAREKLESVKLSSITHANAALFANLARRLGLFRQALKILHPFVVTKTNPSTMDLIEYASNLRRLGLIHQCEMLLRRADHHSETSLHLAFCAAQMWDYEVSLKHLESYLSQSGLEDKQRRVAEVNRVSAFINLGHYADARQLLPSLTARCEQDYPHLYLNCLELDAHLHIAERQWSEAQIRIARAQEVTAKELSAASLLVEKWNYLLLCKRRNLRFSDPEISEFRARVSRQGKWEALRHFDWELAKANQDVELARSVYFGSPYPALKNQIRQSSFGKDIGSFMIRKDARWKGEESLSINALIAENLPTPFALAQHRLILLLLADRYHPWNIYRIFDCFFPGEIFDPFSSPKRVYQMLERLAKDLKKHQVPLELNVSEHGYRIRPLGRGQVYVYENMIFADSEDLMRTLLSLVFGDQEFSLDQVIATFPLERPQAYRLLKRLKESGFVKTRSWKNKIRYTVNSI